MADSTLPMGYANNCKIFSPNGRDIIKLHESTGETWVLAYDPASFEAAWIPVVERG
jgi:hypothetical protein